MEILLILNIHIFLNYFMANKLNTYNFVKNYLIISDTSQQVYYKYFGILITNTLWLFGL